MFRQVKGLKIFRAIGAGAVPLITGAILTGAQNAETAVPKIENCLVVWNMAGLFIFPYIGNKQIPTDELHHFFRGVGIPPTSIYIYTIIG